MTDEIDDICETFDEVASSIQSKLRDGVSWGYTGGHRGQYGGDVEADKIALEILHQRGYRVFSEESGTSEAAYSSESQVTIVVDPVDGSTNAAKGIPFYAISLCAVQNGLPLVGYVRNFALGVTYQATRSGASYKNGTPISSSTLSDVEDAIVALNGYPKSHFGWSQFRAFGSSALELCMVAEGSLDGFVDFSDEKLAVWDILAGVLICRAAGGCVLQSDGNDFEVGDLTERKSIVAAGNRKLAEELLNRALG